MRLTVAVVAFLTSLAGLTPAAAAPMDNTLKAGDTIKSGKVELTVVEVGQLHTLVKHVTVHTGEVEPVSGAKACIRSHLEGRRISECGAHVVAHGDHYDIRIKKRSNGFVGAYDGTRVVYRYDDPDDGTAVTGRRVIGFPVSRLQSPTESNLYLYPKGEDLYDGPGTVCSGDLLRLKGSINSWDTNIGADADFHGAPFLVQFRARGVEAWSTVRTEVLDGSRDSRPSWGYLQPRGQKSLLVRAHTTGHWRIHWPAQVIGDYAFAPTNFPLGYSRVTRCV